MKRALRFTISDSQGINSSFTADRPVVTYMGTIIPDCIKGNAYIQLTYIDKTSLHSYIQQHTTSMVCSSGT